ncbi:MAG: hypothetical protein GY859_34855 [Desulfobacterales bacterium]|nr:hypothetical protein [Desulfobacterales bacterium]
MKKTIVILLIILVLWSAAPAWAQKPVLLIKNRWMKTYTEVFEGFKSHIDHDYEILDIRGLSEKEIRQEVRDIDPLCFLSIGWSAVVPVEDIENVPMVYVYAYDSRELLKRKKNITGVSMHIPPAFQISTLKSAMPSLRSVGLFITPYTRPMIREAREAAAKLGVNLVLTEVEDRGDIPDMLDNTRGKVSAFWMLPDHTLWTDITARLLFGFSLKNHVPVITTSKRYMKYGGLILIDHYPRDLGRMTAGLVEEILNGGNIDQIPPVRPEKFRVSISPKVARRFYLTIPREFIEKAEKYKE